jgi:hypothetical protein
MASAAFPARLIKVGEQDTQLVRTIQAALRQRGYGPFTDGVFDESMKAVVKTFQAQNVDRDGHSLEVDGKIGLLTWQSLFAGSALAPLSPPAPASTLMLQALAVAAGQVGEMESPIGSNRGPMVDEYLRAAGIDPASGPPDVRPWCMAFAYWCFKTAAANLGSANPLPRTAGCLDHWNLAAQVVRAKRMTAASVLANPSLIKSGLLFILDFGHGLGHTGIVERLLPGGRLLTIEGNTNADGSRTGVGVFRLERRKLSDAQLKGFVDYSGA